ncbi:MAG: ECF-type sigma factor [Planctomycetota bacterium]
MGVSVEEASWDDDSKHEGEDTGFTQELFEMLYTELRGIAARQLGRLPSGQTLQPTEIVHEAFGKLRDKKNWKSRAHFLNTAAKAMRQLLVDRANRRLTQKRGGNLSRTSSAVLDDRIVSNQPDEDLLNVHEALDQLAKQDARAAKLVELTFFLGMGQLEAATTIGISERTARRDLVFAHSWLASQLKQE